MPQNRPDSRLRAIGLQETPSPTKEQLNLDESILAVDCGRVIRCNIPVRLDRLRGPLSTARAASSSRWFECCRRTAGRGEASIVFLGQALHSPAAGAPWCTACSTDSSEVARPAMSDCVLCGSPQQATVLLETGRTKLVARLCEHCIDSEGILPMHALERAPA